MWYLIIFLLQLLTAREQKGDSCSGMTLYFHLCKASFWLSLCLLTNTLLPDPRSSIFTRSFEHLNFIPYPDISAYFSLQCCEDRNKMLEGSKKQRGLEVPHDEIIGRSVGTSVGFKVLV